MVKPACLHCRYCYRYLRDEGYGQCRRHAPIPIMVNIFDNPEILDEVIARPVWPEVELTDWCGEWQSITEQYTYVGEDDGEDSKADHACQ